MDHADWMQDAACRGQTHLFFAPHRERPAQEAVRVAKALALCAGCPVQEPCDAQSRGEYGIWAGKKEVRVGDI